MHPPLIGPKGYLAIVREYTADFGRRPDDKHAKLWYNLNDGLVLN